MIFTPKRKYIEDELKKEIIILISNEVEVCILKMNGF